MRLKKWAVAVVSAITLGVASSVTVSTPAMATSSGHVQGWIYCATGGVEGVYVNKVSGSGSSGWANVWTVGSSNAQYAYDGLNSGATFSLSVGCGGSPGSWQYSTRTKYNYTAPFTGDFTCIPGYSGSAGGTNLCIQT